MKWVGWRNLFAIALLLSPLAPRGETRATTDVGSSCVASCFVFVMADDHVRGDINHVVHANVWTPEFDAAVAGTLRFDGWIAGLKESRSPGLAWICRR